MEYYQRLRDLREDKDLKQEDIAKILKTTQSYYAQYENGKRQVPFDRIIELAKFYDVSIDYIAGLTNEKRKISNREDKYNITQTNNKNAIVQINNKKKRG